MSNTVVFFERKKAPKPPKEPGDSGTEWTDQELDALFEQFDSGATIEEILETSKRTAAALVSKLVAGHRLTLARGGYARRDPLNWVSFDWLSRHKNLREEQ